LLSCATFRSLQTVAVEIDLGVESRIELNGRRIGVGLKVGTGVDAALGVGASDGATEAVALTGLIADDEAANVVAAVVADDGAADELHATSATRNSPSVVARADVSIDVLLG